MHQSQDRSAGKRAQNGVKHAHGAESDVNVENDFDCIIHLLQRFFTFFRKFFK